ncbi:MAG: hypothetical protein PUA93_05265 [Eubacteriales bacterium]|nr:hypothetical protein [Eubacteriales bacterium]
MNQPKELISLWSKISDRYPEIHISLLPYQDTGSEFSALLQKFGQDVDIVVATGDINLWKGNFKEVPLGKTKAEITLSSLNPLSFKKKLSIEDLKGYAIRITKKGNWPELDTIVEDLEKRNLNIHFIERENYDFSDYNDLASTQEFLIGPKTWASTHPLLVSLPVDWKYTFETKLLVPENPRPEVKTFLKAIEEAKKLK